NTIAMYFATKLEGMLARSIGNVVNKLGDGVGSLELWPFKPTQARKEISAKADAGQPAGQSTRSHTRVKAVTRRRSVKIAGQRGLVKAVVPESGFIHPAYIRDPRPTGPEYLGAGVND